jgi:putative endonuclease
MWRGDAAVLRVLEPVRRFATMPGVPASALLLALALGRWIPMTAAIWHIYILDCDGRLYTGISVDPQRRLAEHRAGAGRGARFTRGAERIEMRYQLALDSRSEALRIEYRIKRLSRAAKLALIAECPDRKTLLIGLRV